MAEEVEVARKKVDTKKYSLSSGLKKGISIFVTKRESPIGGPEKTAGNKGTTKQSTISDSERGIKTDETKKKPIAMGTEKGCQEGGGEDHSNEEEGECEAREVGGCR